MNDATPLVCPKCKCALHADVVRTVRFTTYTSNCNEIGLHAKTDSREWDTPNSSNMECNPDCDDPDCELEHNFDHQRNNQLMSSSPLVYIVDEDDSSDYERLGDDTIESISCDECGWQMSDDDVEKVEILSNY